MHHQKTTLNGNPKYIIDISGHNLLLIIFVHSCLWYHTLTTSEDLGPRKPQQYELVLSTASNFWSITPAILISRGNIYYIPLYYIPLIFPLLSAEWLAAPTYNSGCPVWDLLLNTDACSGGMYIWLMEPLRISALQQHNFHSVTRTSCSCAAGCVSVVFRVGCTTQALHMYRACTPMLHACGSGVVLSSSGPAPDYQLVVVASYGNVDRYYALSSRSPSDGCKGHWQV